MNLKNEKKKKSYDPSEITPTIPTTTILIPVPTILTRPRLSPISKLFAVSSNEFAAIFATALSVVSVRFWLIEVTVHVPLQGGLQTKARMHIPLILKDSLEEFNDV